MSIIDIVPLRIGGMERFLGELAGQLATESWRCIVCLPRAPAGKARQFLEDAGIIVEELSPGSDTLDWRATQNTAALLRRYRPDVLHLSFVGLVSLYPWMARCCSVRRILLTDHCSRPEGYSPTPAVWWKRATRHALNWPIDRVIGVSDYIARYDEALGLVSNDKVARIYNGVDLTKPAGDGSRFREKYAIPDNRAIVLQVSWMIPEKGIIDLLDAAKATLSANARAHFVICGEGSRRAEYMKYAADKDITDHVTWTGLLEDPFSEGVYDAADVVCQLSRWQEAFGLVIAEAMACRKPVVATNVGGIPEVVTDGSTGFLVPPREPDAAAQKILQLLGDPRLRAQMGNAGRARAERLFDLRRTVAELIQLSGIPKTIRPAMYSSAAVSGREAE